MSVVSDTKVEVVEILNIEYVSDKQFSQPHAKTHELYLLLDVAIIQLEEMLRFDCIQEPLQVILCRPP